MNIKNVIHYLLAFIGIFLLMPNYNNGEIGSGDIAELNEHIQTIGGNVLTLANMTSEVLQKGAKVIESLGKIAAWAGPAGMVISSVLSIVSMFMPKPDSEELVAIKKGFKELNEKIDTRFDALEKKMTAKFDEVKNLIKAVDVLRAYDDNRKSLPFLVEKYDTFIRNPDKKSMDEFLTLCDKESPYRILFNIHSHIVGSASTTPVLQSIFDDRGDDFEGIVKVLTRFMSDAATAAYFEQACLGVKKASEDEKEAMRIRMDEKLQELTKFLQNGYKSHFSQVVMKILIEANENNNKTYENYNGDHRIFAHQLQVQLSSKLKFVDKEWFVLSSDYISDNFKTSKAEVDFLLQESEFGGSLNFTHKGAMGPNFKRNKNWNLFVAWCSRKYGKLTNEEQTELMLDQAEIEIRELDSQCSDVTSPASIYNFLTDNMPSFIDATAKVVSAVYSGNAMSFAVESRDDGPSMPLGVSKDIKCGRWFLFCKTKHTNGSDIVLAHIFLAFNLD